MYLSADRELSKRVLHVEHNRRKLFSLYTPMLYAAHVRLTRMKKIIQELRSILKFEKHVGSWSSGKEKLPTRLEAHHKAQWSEIFLSFQEKLKTAVIFYLFANDVETAYLSFRDRELSKDVRLVELRRIKLQFTPFWGGPKLGCSDSLRAGIIESHNFFFLRSYPGEISHSNSANQELSNDVSLLEVLPRKVALHTSSHLTPTEA